MTRLPNRALAAIAVVLVLAAALVYVVKTRHKAEPAIKTAGIIEGIEVNLAAKAAGKIGSICCNEGDNVRQGQVAISLDSEDLKAAVAQSVANVEKAKVQMEEAEKKLKRARGLVQKEFISQEALDSAVAARDASVADFHLANATLAFNQAKLADTTILSPVSGTVVFKAFEKGEMVSPGQTILTIVDLASLYARVDLDETLIGRISLNSEAWVTTTGQPARTFRGRVSEIGRYAEFATERDVTRGRQDIKTFHVKIAVEDRSGALKPGMTVEVKIPTPFRNE